jgi:hypothetical protein
VTLIRHEDSFREIVGADAELMEILSAVRSVAPPDWVVGSGAIRIVV